MVDTEEDHSAGGVWGYALKLYKYCARVAQWQR
jgi:hypothetical protein